METNKNETKKTKINKKAIKKWFKNHAPVICISFAAFIILVGVLLALFQAEEELVKFTVKDEKLYTYSGTIKMEFDTEVTIDHDNNVSKLMAGEEEIELYTEPIYYENKKQVVFPNTMSVIFPLNERVQKKINRYTVINAEGAQPFATNIKLNYALFDAFVYDGADVYFFLDSGKIKYADKVVEFSAFSFLRCEYNGSIYLYDYEKKEMYYEEEYIGVVTAEMPGYSINVSYDKITVDGEPSLLNKNINALGKLGK